MQHTQNVFHGAQTSCPDSCFSFRFWFFIRGRRFGGSLNSRLSFDTLFGWFRVNGGLDWIDYGVSPKGVEDSLSDKRDECRSGFSDKECFFSAWVDSRPKIVLP